jgi:transcription elongation factor GreA-like protein
MDQSKILRYALKHLAEKIVKLEDYLTNSDISESQRNLFEHNLTNYISDYDEIAYMLDNL